MSKDDQVAAAKMAINTQLSSGRFLRQLSGKGAGEGARPGSSDPIAPSARQKKSPDIISLENQISERVGYPCEIKHDPQTKKGYLAFSPYDDVGMAVITESFPKDMFTARARVTLDFNDNEDLYDLLGKIFPPEDDF